MRLIFPDPTPVPGVYSARQIVVLDICREKEIERTEIVAEGNYSLTRPLGTYVVDVKFADIDSDARLQTECGSPPARTRR